MKSRETDAARAGGTFVEGKGFVLLMGALTALDPMSIDMYLPAFGQIRDGFGTSIANVELSVSTFFVGMSLGQLVYGPLADRFGRRRPLLGGMVVYFFATLGCLFAPGIRAFIAFRLLQALGGCAGMVITRAVVRDLFDTKRVAGFLSNMALVMGVAPILAPSVGALISARFGWRAVFLILCLANASCMVAIAAFLPETLAPAARRDLRPSSILRAYGNLLGNRRFVGYMIPDSALRAGMFAYIAGSPFVFIQLFHIPESSYGLIFGLNGVGLMLASQLNRRLLRSRRPEVILGWSVKVGALAAAVVFLATWAGLPHVVVLGSIFVFLATLNFVSPNSLASALASQGHQAGTASALYGCLQWGSATASSFLVSSLHDGTARPMTGTILTCGMVSLLAYSLLVRPRGPSEDPPS